MRYLLDKRYLLRGWQNAHTGVVDAQERTTSFLRKDEYLLLIRCDGVHDIDEGRLSASEREFLDGARRAGLIRPARFLELLADEQRYAVFPAPYKELVEWSVTGACNLRCRHCFMSAPQAKHGSPAFEQLVDVADQLAECGVFRAVVTGGEPCMRDDLLDLVDALGERGIAIEKILTNGWLLDDAFLDGLDARGVRTRFQLSFDGVGCHDFLRGVPGAEERTVRAIGLLRERGHEVTTALCLHRGNRHALRESVLDTAATDGRRVSICGYSLAGLFALWAACQTERFSGVAAVSPSVWYPGWLDYLRAHPLRAQRVYLSLGDREEKTRNPVMATVGSALRETQALLTAAGIETQLDWNPGNHFVDSDKRTARGMAWLTGNDRIPTAYTP